MFFSKTYKLTLNIELFYFGKNLVTVELLPNSKIN